MSADSTGPRSGSVHFMHCSRSEWYFWRPYEAQIRVSDCTIRASAGKQVLGLRRPDISWFFRSVGGGLKLHPIAKQGAWGLPILPACCAQLAS